MSSALSLSGLVAFSHLQVSQIPGPAPAYLCEKFCTSSIHRLRQRSGSNRRVIYELVLAIAPEINYSVGGI